MINDNYLTVSALNRYIKRKFEMDKHLNDVWLKGEISNFKHHSRGHMYLTIKDDQARIKAVMFAGYNRTLKFEPEDGMNVLIKGEINVYEPQGQYQLYIQQMEPDGVGALYVAFEQLKEKLTKEGLFEHDRKLPLPLYPKHIGVITSPTGAAVRDILITLKRRYPIANITIFPALVQGEMAPSSVANAIGQANQLKSIDVLIVGRGGGSIEELWAFNEEVVARAIAGSMIPIISAVGHETDVTIADFVADVRAATPTGAAELAVPSIQELEEKIKTWQQSLNRVMQNKVGQSTKHLERLKKSYAFRYPVQLLNQKEQDLDKMVERLAKATKQIQSNENKRYEQLMKRLAYQHPEAQLKLAEKQLMQIVERNKRAMQVIYTLKNRQFINVVEKLEVLSPLHTMKRGYAIAYGDNGTLIQSTKEIQLGEAISVKVVDGRLDCHVMGIKEDLKND